MDQGAIVETGLPQQIYRSPQAEFTAQFIGVANALDATVTSSDATGIVLQSQAGIVRADPIPALQAGEAVRAFIRPENIELSRKQHGPDDWQGTIRFCIYQGDSWDYTVDVNGLQLRVRIQRDRSELGHGDTVYLRPVTSEAVIMRVRDGVAHATTKGTA
jgi:iron(III) transport system ATP-binding protein